MLLLFVCNKLQKTVDSEFQYSIHRSIVFKKIHKGLTFVDLCENENKGLTFVKIFVKTVKMQPDPYRG